MEELTVEVVGLLILLATVVERISEAITGFIKSALAIVSSDAAGWFAADSAPQNFMKPLALVISFVIAWSFVQGFDLNLVAGVGLDDGEGRFLTVAIIALGSDTSHQVIKAIRDK